MSSDNFEDPAFRPVDDFVENEACTRFTLNPPTELLDFDPIWEREVAEGSQDGRDPPIDKENRKELMIQKMWSRLQVLLETDGYSGLDQLSTRLEAHYESEKDRLASRRVEAKSLKLYLELIEKALEEGRDKREFAGLFWHSDHSPPTEVKVVWDESTLMPGQFPLRITLTQDAQRNKNISPPPASPPLKIGVQESLVEVKQRLKAKKGKVVSEAKATRQLCRLINFRHEVLARFLWTFEVGGKPVEEVTTSRTPDGIPPKRVQHACTVLKAIPDEEEDIRLLIGDDSGWPTQKQLGEFLDREYGDRIQVEPSTVVDKAAALLRDDLAEGRYESFSKKSPTFWDLLLHPSCRGTIRDLEAEMDLDVPTRSDPPSE